MATAVAMRMTPGRENFWIRIVIAFILFWFPLCWFSYVLASKIAPASCSTAAIFGFSAAGESFFCFSRRVGKAAQGRGPDS